MVKKRNSGCGRYTFYAPAHGYSRNILVNYGRNLPCLCGSEVKFKKCCLPRMPRYIPADVALRMEKDKTHKEAIFFEWYRAEVEAQMRKKDTLSVASLTDAETLNEITQEDLDNLFERKT